MSADSQTVGFNGTGLSPVSDVAAQPWTIQRIIVWSTNFLTDKGTDTPRLDAELLLCAVLQCKRIQLYMNFDKPVTVSERDAYKVLLRRRAANEPIAYILGEKEFMGLTFKVNRDVLIPRPDTEILVEAALAFLKSRASKHILDIGTGSGCIPISLAKLGQASGTAWDLSDAALAVASGNAEAHGITDICFGRVDALSADAFEQRAAALHGYDLIISNPPYISVAERDGLAASVREFEPHAALFAAEDGLLFYRVIAERCSSQLKADGKLMFEIGWTQGRAVTEILSERGWSQLQVIKDLAGRDRVVIATPPPPSCQEGA